MQALSCCEGQRHRFFVYGTLKKGQPNAYHFLSAENGKARFIANASTEDVYPLIIATRWNLPFLLYAPGQGKKIQGEIYEVDDAMMSFMDEFEGHPEVYQRERVRVVCHASDSCNHGDTSGANASSGGGRTEECWVYFLKTFPPGLLKKSSLSSYDAFGIHGKFYQEDKDLCGPENIYDALKEEC